MATGRPTEITDEAIIAAGNELIAENKRVTGFSLRKKTGGGDPSRLISVWEKHLQNQAVIEAEPVQELPVEVASKLAELTKAVEEQFKLLAVGINTTAVNTAEQRVAQVIATAEEQQEKAKAELIDATETVNELEALLDKMKVRSQQQLEQLQAAAKENKTLLAEKSVLEQELAVCKAELKKTEEANKSINEKLDSLLSRINMPE